MKDTTMKDLLQSVEYLGSVMEQVLYRLDVLENVVFEDSDDPNDPNESTETSPIIIRHSRYYDEFGYTSNLGGVTYAFRINHGLDMADVGISICNKNDNFDRNIGRAQATMRLDQKPLSFLFPLDSTDSLGLVDSFWKAYNEGFVSGDNDMLDMIGRADLDGLDCAA